MKRALAAGLVVVSVSAVMLGRIRVEPTSSLAVPECSGVVGAEAHEDGRPSTCTAVGGVYQWIPVSRRIEGAGVLNFDTILLNGCATQTISPAAFVNVTTDYVVACFPMTSLTGGAFLAQSWMSATGEVSIKVCSIGVVTDPPSTTFGCVVAL